MEKLMNQSFQKMKKLYTTAKALEQYYAIEWVTYAKQC